MDLLIKNGTVVTPGGRMRADVWVENERIAAIAAPAELPAQVSARRIIDASGLYILPGIMDPHVHFRDPGHTYKEDFSTGSAAAAAGGVTTVYDMPNNLPRTVGAAELEEKLRAIQNRAHVDYALYGLVTQENCAQLRSLADSGVRGFKCLMGISVMNTPTGRDVDIWKALQILKETGCALSVHAEDTQVCAEIRQQLRQAGRSDALAHLESHPTISETLAVERAIMVAQASGGRIHIAHISAAETVGLIRRAKMQGVNVTCETGPHNLYFTDADYDRKGPMLFMNPPVRGEQDRQALLEGLRDGTVDMIATDHAPHTLEEKLGGGDIFQCKSGFCGLETTVPVMLTLVNRGLLTLEQYVKAASENVAKLFGLYPQKGSMQIGTDADFTIVDLRQEHCVHSSDLHSRSKISAFDGETLVGAPVYTVVRGHVVMERGTVHLDNVGRFLR